MEQGLKPWQLMLCISLLCVFFAAGWFAGADMGALATTTKLTREAVREKAGQWTAGADGEAAFKWLVCQPVGVLK